MRNALLLLLLTGRPSLGAEEPVLHVKARTRLELESVVRVPGGVVVRGSLFDTALEEPIPGRTVAIAVDGPNGFYRYAEPTSDEGTFRWRVPLPLGQYTLRLAAGGDDDYAPAPAVERRLDVGRRSPTLTLQAPDRVSIKEEQVEITVAAQDPEQSEEVPELPVTILIDGRPFASGITRGGKLSLQLAVHELGKVGAQVTLAARFDGDPLRNPVQATRTLRLTTPTTLTLRAERQTIGGDEELGLDGVLTDASGPVPSGVIDLEAIALSPPGKPHVVATGFTDAAGRFTAHVPGLQLGWGPFAVEARFRVAGGFREPSRSGPLEVTVHATSFHASPIYLIPPLLTALVLAGMAIARRRPWVTVAARLRARAARPAPSSGLSEGRTHILRTLRPAADFGLAGQVCDSATSSPIVGATLVVDVGGEHRSAVTDEQGRFALEGLPGGTLAVEVAAAGYVSERFHRTVPHRGELRGARVLLVPIRARIFAAYDRAAQPLAPRPQVLETWTPRELLQHVRTKRLLTVELQHLTNAVEQSCYGPTPPDLEALAEVERLVATVGPPRVS